MHAPISVLDSETLDNATLNFGAGATDDLSTGMNNDSGHTLTLGSGFTIDVNGGTDYLGFHDWITDINDAADTLNSAGRINVSSGDLLKRLFLGRP